MAKDWLKTYEIPSLAKNKPDEFMELVTLNALEIYNRSLLESDVKTFYTVN